MSDHKMLWIDLETTGLDARSEVPLELGLILTDEYGQIHDSQAWQIYEPENESFCDTVDNCVQFVRDMHNKSGLWDDLNECPTMTRDEVATDACDWLSEHGVKFFTLPMAGSSIGSLDRPFVQQHLPKLNMAFHYRNIDISTLKEICNLVNPELMKRLAPLMGSKEDATHRVLEDAEASINEYILYLENFLMVEE